MTDFIKLTKAASFAADAHVGQLRKYTGEPYIVHPLAVAKMVADFGGTLPEIMAAMLHDTIEDVDHITAGVIELNFGTKVALLVDGMTKRPWKQAKDRAERKHLERQRLAQTTPGVHTIKCADVIDNTKTIVQFDPKFGVTYIKEAEALLAVLGNAIPELHQLATAHVKAEKAKLKVMGFKFDDD